MIKNIFFDFDGVILDSVDCKTEAFYQMYLKYGETIAEEVKSYHLSNGGISRFEKFKYWEKKYFNRELNKNELMELANEFSNLVLENVINSKPIKGALEFITKDSNYKKFIITGTPTNEIIEITNRLGISKYFIEINGSPEEKTYWTEHLIKKYNLNRNQTIFIGDASTDYKAAIFSKLKFALRKAEYNSEFFKSIEVFKFSDFKQLENYINE